MGCYRLKRVTTNATHPPYEPPPPHTLPGDVLLKPLVVLFENVLRSERGIVIIGVQSEIVSFRQLFLVPFASSCLFLVDTEHVISIINRAIPTRAQVLRFNAAPTKTFEEFTGSKTTFRLLNRKSADAMLEVRGNTGVPKT